MRLSIIVIFHNMARESPRTLLSLSDRYQRGVSSEDYEVIAIDNSSVQPLNPEMVVGSGRNFRHKHHQTNSASPVEAINVGIEMARGTAIAVIVDGARMASPGIVAWTLKALELAKDPLIGALSWHLGPDVQNKSMLNGYDQATEDALLHEIGWPEDGYRLFEIATLAQSSSCGFLGGIPRELSWFCMSASSLVELGGYDPKFLSPGGGLVNHDIVLRALARPSVTPIMLLGEGVFHQIHGGVATNVKLSDHPMPIFKQEYRLLRGQPYRWNPIENVYYIGAMANTASRFITES